MIIVVSRFSQITLIFLCCLSKNDSVESGPDIVPTILELLEIEPAPLYKGYDQIPISGLKVYHGDNHW